jgi:hypothetical protein
LLLEEVRMGSPIVQNIVLLCGLVVQIVTLWYLIKYVRATVGIQNAAVAQTRASQDLVKVGNDQIKVSQELVKAANEQSEGLSKPVIVVVSSPDIPDRNAEMGILGGGLFSEIGDRVQLQNIGTGPALWVEWSARGQYRAGESQEPGVAGFVPYLRPDETVDTECPRAYVSGLSSLAIECTYQSLGRTRYTSKTTVGDRDSTCHEDRFKIMTFEVKTG